MRARERAVVLFHATVKIVAAFRLLSLFAATARRATDAIAAIMVPIFAGTIVI
jgi:hypothetical protein